MEEPKRSENFIPEDFEDEQAVDSDDTRKAEKTPEDVKRVIFPTVEDLEMAEILGLSKDMLDDFSRIKATYRTAIAQYHPDKVSALGAEIQDVAEKKQKKSIKPINISEINSKNLDERKVSDAPEYNVLKDTYKMLINDSLL